MDISRFMCRAKVYLLEHGLFLSLAFRFIRVWQRPISRAIIEIDMQS